MEPRPINRGDGGRTDGWWEVHAQGAIAAVRAGMPRSPLKIDISAFRGHPILRYTCGKSASYFIRLPDGHIRTRKGIASTGFQTLEQLRDSGKMAKAVDRSTTYANWRDLCLTLKEVLESEWARVGRRPPERKRRGLRRSLRSWGSLRPSRARRRAADGL